MKQAAFLIIALIFTSFLYFIWNSGTMTAAIFFEVAGTAAFLVAFFALTHGLSRLIEVSKKWVAQINSKQGDR